MKIRVVLEPSEDGGYTAYVPFLPGCISEGESVQDASVNIQEAIGLYLDPAEEGFAPPTKPTCRGDL
jgi:predicted RNase H-like HicB family nuclease